MENRSLKTYDDIVKYLEYLEVEYNKSYTELSNINIGLFEFGEKKEKEERRRSLKRQLLDYVVSYEQCDRFLKDVTTFRRQDFVKFLADFFSIVYGKKYVVQNDVKDRKQKHPVISYDLVISEDDLKNCSGDNNLMDSLSFSELFERCNDCCLLLDNSLKFTLLDGKDLSADFEDFPELIAAARMLVDLKLSNPEMSDQKRLLTILNNSCIELKTSGEGYNPHGISGPRLEKVYSENNQ